MLTNKEIQYNCPKCQGNFTVKMKQVTDNETIQCPTCKTDIHLEDKNGMGKNKSKHKS